MYVSGNSPSVLSISFVGIGLQSPEIGGMQSNKRVCPAFVRSSNKFEPNRFEKLFSEFFFFNTIFFLYETVIFLKTDVLRSTYMASFSRRGSGAELMFGKRIVGVSIYSYQRIHAEQQGGDVCTAEFVTFN